VQDHVERRGRNLERGGALLARALLQNAESEGTPVAGVEPADDLDHPLPGHGQVVRLALHGIPRVALALVDLSLQVLGLKNGFALASPQLVERDAQRHDAEPGIDAHRLPRKLVEALDDFEVRHRQRLLGGGLGAEARQKHGPKQPGAVGSQQLPEGCAIAPLSPRAQGLLGSQLRAVRETAAERRSGGAIG